MTGVAVLRDQLVWSKNFVHMYLGDLADADLLVRPVPGAKHIAWQLGHMIVGEISMVKAVFPDAKYPNLPDQFAEIHDAKNSVSESTSGFLIKEEYLKLFDATHATSLDLLAHMTDADLDRAGPSSMESFAPTVGALFALLSAHILMHAGQFAVVRRKLSKPIVF